MADKLIPEHIDPYRYTEQRLTVQGSVNLAEMARLGSSLNSSEGHASVNLQFGIDSQAAAFLKGHLEATLTLECQRCLLPFKYNIISDFILGIVKTVDEANALPGSYEPVLVKAGELALRELIEDELILNLPIIPKHEPENCKVKMTLSDSGWGQGEGKNPFHVLETLKQK
jgi:uncharacterized protein